MMAFTDRERNFPAAGAHRSGALYDERGGGYDKGDQSFVQCGGVLSHFVIHGKIIYTLGAGCGDLQYF